MNWKRVNGKLLHFFRGFLPWTFAPLQERRGEAGLLLQRARHGPGVLLAKFAHLRFSVCCTVLSAMALPRPVPLSGAEMPSGEQFSLSLGVVPGASWDAIPDIGHLPAWSPLRESIPKPIGPRITHYAFCTIYYTPREFGFRRELGFDTTPETRAGLGGRKYPRDFLRAVRVEGFGRLAEPVRGANYIKFDGRTWGFATNPLGNVGNKLIARRSCAVSARGRRFPSAAELFIESPSIIDVFRSGKWKVADTGGGLHRWQIDLYWGEDDPHSPWHVTRPKGTDFEREFTVEVFLRKK